jgi:hypothetical protein
MTIHSFEMLKHRLETFVGNFRWAVKFPVDYMMVYRLQEIRIGIASTVVVLKNTLGLLRVN